MFRFSVLSSGSKGNALYVESDRARILIDAGLGPRVLAARMTAIGRNPGDLTAVFLTHEHSDHVSGIPALTKRHRVQLFATRGTQERLRGYSGPDSLRCTIGRDDGVTLGDLQVESYPTPHDAAESVAFVVRCGTRTLGHATDLGQVTDAVRDKLQGCDALLVESNHDVDMLMNGGYPWPLKQRIQGDEGHLSNDACADLLRSVNHPGLRRVVLMHLSESNNSSEIALRSARRAVHNESVHLSAAMQGQPTPLVTLD